MTIDLDEFRKYLLIDKMALDDEVVRQPSLFEAVALAYVDAACDRDALKEQLATVDAKLDGEIRAKFADEKVTEGQIKSKIQVDYKHVSSMDQYLLAKHEADSLNVLKDAFQQRGYMLRDLASLYVAGYFQSESVKPTKSVSDTVYDTRKEKLRRAYKGK